MISPSSSSRVPSVDILNANHPISHNNDNPHVDIHHENHPNKNHHQDDDEEEYIVMEPPWYPSFILHSMRPYLWNPFTPPTFTSTATLTDSVSWDPRRTLHPTISNHFHLPVPSSQLLDDEANFRIQRREELRNQLYTRQRYHFRLFALFCILPILFLAIRITAPITDGWNEEQCYAQEQFLQLQLLGTSDTNTKMTFICRKEKSHFTNAFTSRCLCSALNATAIEDSP